MGYIAHHAVVATGLWRTRLDPSTGRWDLPSDWVLAVEDFRAMLVARFGAQSTWPGLLVGPVPAVTNGYASVVFLPDGSKEGWDESDKGDELRLTFCALCEKHEADWVLVRFGGDDSDMAHVVAHDGDPERRRDQATM